MPIGHLSGFSDDGMAPELRARIDAALIDSKNLGRTQHAILDEVIIAWNKEQWGGNVEPAPEETELELAIYLSEHGHVSCGECGHRSDCSLHNRPALIVDHCDCGRFKLKPVRLHNVTTADLDQLHFHTVIRGIRHFPDRSYSNVYVKCDLAWESQLWYGETSNVPSSALQIVEGYDVIEILYSAAKGEY